MPRDMFDPPPFEPRVVTVKLLEYRPGRYVDEDGRLFASRENPAAPRMEVEAMLDRLRAAGAESAAEEAARFGREGIAVEKRRSPRRRLTLCPECRSVLKRGRCVDCGSGDLTSGTPRARVDYVGPRRAEVEIERNVPLGEVDRPPRRKRKRVEVEAV